MAPTLIPPPPDDASKAPIENVLELTSLAAIGPDLFTNTRPLWHPPGARGIYGGAAIAQSLAAAQLTIPPPSPANGQAKFFVHSMHCYFVLAGDASIPVLYSVERVREGKSFMTRTVQARQRGKCIFTTTLSFVREGSAGKETVKHAADLPEGAREQLDQMTRTEKRERGKREGRATEEERENEANGQETMGPFESRRMGIGNARSARAETKKTRAWIRARGTISPDAGQEAHLSALAYMSDSWFIGTVARVQNLWRFASPRTTSDNTVNKAVPEHARQLALQEERENMGAPGPVRKVGMMVSLDHTIFFHHPQAVKADEWMFQEMQSPWAGDGRGLVMQKVWSKDGELLATCVQEGLVRLQQSNDSLKGKL